MPKSRISGASDEEAQSLVRETIGMRDPTAPSTKEKSSGSTMWKVMTFILLGIIILIATDSIEIKNAHGDGDYRGDLHHPI